MTQITGKIYQMKDASGNENRFPRTVIEAVLGLSSYLQNQFSSLADIYMPIGGIYQSQTGQEFVYRATPNTIKAKSFTLDRIQGKTLAWNQLAKLNIESSYTDRGITFTKNNDGSVTISGTPSVTDVIITYAAFPVTSSNHKLAIREYSSTNNYAISYSNWYRYDSSYNGSWRIVTGSAINNIGIYIASENAINIKVYYQCIDLTLLYGSEIDGMTDAEILAKFESEYPGYHDYSAGKLISNDAKQLETVGFNQWDEEWESGYYTEQGADYADNHAIRTKNFISVLPGTEYYWNKPQQGRLYYYDANKTLLWRTEPLSSSTTFTTPSNCCYLKFFLFTSISGYSYNYDICINLSDESFNGQYEPYRKVVLPLNLDDFWVKDGQGNQVHITGGLKSAGSVYDEIVGNKYIKRVGSVDLGGLGWTYGGGVFYAPIEGVRTAGYSGIANAICSKYPITSWGNMTDKTASIFNAYAIGINIKDSDYSDATTFKTAMNGVMLDFELDTPIEYDLVEPLIYTMKAGTTESRISPNEDGLSAPFCCDMTYSASDNNDADNAQYAATAGRLLNTHTILGQQFNGTQDIGGAISDVSSIDGAIHFDLTDPNSPLVGISTTTPTVRLDVNGNVKAAQLISTVTGTLASGTPPLTVASKTMVSNLNANYVGGKTLSEILASDITGNAATATKLQTGRNITISDGTHSGTSVSFDGSASVTLPLPTNLNVGTLDASGAITLAGTGSTNKRIYFDSNIYLELTTNGLHLHGAGFYADSFITAYGTNESAALEALKDWVTENFEPKQS